MRYLILIVLFAWTSLTGEVLAEKRVALVIGIERYEGTSRIENAIRDAELVASSLERVGFAVSSYHDVDSNGLVGALADFSLDATNAEIAFFYFAGLGVRVDGQDLLVPSGAKLEPLKSLRQNAISLKDVIGSLTDVSGVSIITIDACRTEILSAKIETSASGEKVYCPTARLNLPDGFFVSVANNTVDDKGKKPASDNSYAQVLARLLTEPGLEIRDMFAQLDGQLPKPADNAKATVSVSALPEKEVFLTEPITRSLSGDEFGEWVALSESSDVKALEAFIRKFPGSIFAQDAKDRIAKLKASGND